MKKVWVVSSRYWVNFFLERAYKMDEFIITKLNSRIRLTKDRKIEMTNNPNYVRMVLSYEDIAKLIQALKELINQA